jgi:hypothetical protein
MNATITASPSLKSWIEALDRVGANEKGATRWGMIQFLAQQIREAMSMIRPDLYWPLKYLIPRGHAGAQAGTRAGDRTGDRLPDSPSELDDEEQPAYRGGHFFAVDSHIWPVVCSLGMNAAVAYLVLACGTGKDLLHTTWSVHAVEKYTSISRGRAAEAIRLLVDKGMLSPAGGAAKHPRYRLNPIRETPRPVPRRTDRPGSETSPSSWIWLPNALVTGAASEVPPVELVRQMQDVMTLRLLVELYGDQHLRVWGGVRRDLVWESYQRQRLGGTGQFTVWGFRKKSRHVRWIGAAACHCSSGEESATDFFARLESLESTGLLEFAPHLVEGDGPDAEILHPYGGGDSDSLENRLGTAASDAAYALLTDISQNWATRFEVAPVLRHIRNVQMVGIARLRYRAQTRTAAAWQAEMHESGARHLEVYERIVAQRTAQLARCNING